LALGLTCVAVLFWLKTHVGFVIVDGDSMLPTFESGDLLLIHKRAYRHVEPARGDIVVSRFRSELIVKRIVGLPNETIEVIAGAVHVNASALHEPYPLQPGALEVNPGELMPDRYAVLGDNRSGSDYQLFFAVISRDQIVGKTLLAFRLGRAGLSIWVPPMPHPHHAT
jgi:signal peptidase I